MIFRDFAIRWLGSKAKLKIALHMLAGAGPVGERELSRAVGLSHVAVGKALKDIAEVNFLRKSRAGNVNIWSLNEKSYACLCAKNLEFLSGNPPLLHLKQSLEVDFGEAYRYMKKIVLFGSIAEGTEKESSDIDLFILLEREEYKKAAMKRVIEISERYKELYGNSISPVIMTETEVKKNAGLIKNIDRGIVIR